MTVCHNVKSSVEQTQKPRAIVLGWSGLGSRYYHQLAGRSLPSEIRTVKANKRMYVCIYVEDTLLWMHYYLLRGDASTHLLHRNRTA